MDATLQKEEITEVYERTKKLVYFTVHRFMRQKHLPKDLMPEMISHANWQFMLAYEKYDGRIEFHKYLQWCVWKGLLEVIRIYAVRSKRVAYQDLAPDCAWFTPSKFNLEEWCEGLSQDARVVVRLALNTPHCIAQGAHLRGGKPHNVKYGLRQYLSGMGWSGGRIRNTFNEIRNALQ